MNTQNIITKNEIADGLRALGLTRGDTVYVHSSVKSVGVIDGGAECLLDAFLTVLGSEGTLAVPTHTYCYEHIASEPYAPSSTPSVLGWFPETVRKHPSARRSAHASHSTAAIGARATELTENHNLTDALHEDSPLHRLYHTGGKTLLLGVAHNANTALHMAERNADVPYMRISYNENAGERTVQRNAQGEIVYVQQTIFPGCSGEFRLMDGFFAYNGISKRGLVGHARSQLLDTQPMIDLTVQILHQQPMFLLCPPDYCPACRRRRAYCEAH